MKANELAKKLNKRNSSKALKRFIMTYDGQLLSYCQFDDRNPSKVHKLDGCNNILQTFTLGVDCFMVERKRTETVTETFTVVEA